MALPRHAWSPEVADVALRCERAALGLRLDMMAVEFAVCREGRMMPIDLTTNTNYRARSEEAAGVACRGVDAVGRLLMGRAQRYRTADGRYALW